MPPLFFFQHLVVSLTKQNFYGGYMSFGSLVFLVRFLPVSLLLYYICPKRFRNAFLAILSLLFYAWGDMIGLAVLLGTAVVGYAAALMITRSTGLRRKIWLASGLIMILGCLAVFKYTDLILNTLSSAGLAVSPLGLAAPAGISFFSFTVAGYLIDVYKDDSDLCRSVPDYLLFVSFFPKLLMGPITRYSEMKDAIRDRSVTSEDLEQGSVRFVTGLTKKVILADSIASLWNEVTAAGFANVSCLLCWAGILAFGLQLYYDFSGYSDMASGLARFFGFSLPENFRTPYSSVSATEFWRRWHITMGGWFRQYVYFPLGGSRCGKARNILNILAVWALTGIWHGASWNFLLWGLFYFIVLVIEKQFILKFLEDHRFLGHIYLVFITLIGWSLFAVTDLTQIPVFFSRLFGGTGGISALYFLRNYAVILVICILLCTEQAASFWKKLTDHRGFRSAATLILLLLCLAYITDSTYRPFLYAQF